jgi:hypothetical protein
MGFFKKLGQAVATGAGVGLGLGIASQFFGGFDRIFGNGGAQCCRQYAGCNAHQMQRMNDFMAGRAYQAQIDRQMLTMAYARFMLCG